MIEYIPHTFELLTVALILTSGIVCTVKYKFLQFHLFRNLKMAFGCGKGSLPALATSLGGTVGAGNIVGVAGAVASGGEGAVVWLIIGAFFGMILKFHEVTVYLRRRKKLPDGSFRAGAMYCTKHRILGVLFCAFCIICSLIMGNLTQSIAIYEAVFPNGDSLARHALSALLFVILLVTLSGGFEAISRISSALVPIMGVLYIGTALLVIIIHREAIIPVTKRIIAGAFSRGGLRSMLPAAYGISRGLLSNEGGLGSSSTAIASTKCADESTPYLGIAEVFLSTVTVGLVTAYSLLCSGISLDISHAYLVKNAFSSSVGGFGEFVVRISTVLFAYTSFSGWYYYGMCSAEYLNPKSVYIYRLCFCAAVFGGLFIPIELAVDLSAVAAFLMCGANIAILAPSMLEKDAQGGNHVVGSVFGGNKCQPL